MRIFAVVRKMLMKRCVLPEQIIFFVTNRCNLRCNHCLNYSNANKDLSEPRLDEIKKILESLAPFSLGVITGGEPFLRDDLPEIAELFRLNGKVLRLDIITNGFDFEKIMFLSNRIFDKVRDIPILIQVSIDGPEHIHNRIRNHKDSYRNVLKTLKGLQRLRDIYHNLRIGVISTITAWNENELDQIIHFILNRYSPDTYGINLLRGQVPLPELKNININNYIRSYNIIFSYFNNRAEKKLFSKIFSSYKSLLARNVERVYRNHTTLFPCYAGKLICVIDSLLNVRPCEVLEVNMGNLREFNYNFKKLWFSAKSEEVRGMIKKNNCTCTHECFLQINMLFNLKWIIKILLRFIINMIKQKS